MAYLALVRHGESTWNAGGYWTGWTNVSLTEKGVKEARKAGQGLKDIHFDWAFTSDLIRAQQTLDEIKVILNCPRLPTTEDPALKERDYGDLTGKNKWDIEKKYGEEQFHKWRRGWDDPLPNGESLKDVYNRVISFYQKEILPKLKMGKNILISAHGNSLRALVKYLEKIPDTDIEKLEIALGEIYLYQINSQGEAVDKEIRA